MLPSLSTVKDDSDADDDKENAGDPDDGVAVGEGVDSDGLNDDDSDPCETDTVDEESCEGVGEAEGEAAFDVEDDDAINEIVEAGVAAEADMEEAGERAVEEVAEAEADGEELNLTFPTIRRVSLLISYSPKGFGLWIVR